MATYKLGVTYRTKPVFGLRSERRISLQNIVYFVQSLRFIKMLVKESIAATFPASYIEIYRRNKLKRNLRDLKIDSSGFLRLSPSLMCNKKYIKRNIFNLFFFQIYFNSSTRVLWENVIKYEQKHNWLVICKGSGRKKVEISRKEIKKQYKTSSVMHTITIYMRNY
jgi:hypothetical protein